MSPRDENSEKRNNLIELYRVARKKEWKPWELQTELRSINENVVSVGDDLSFTVKLDSEIEFKEEIFEDLGGRKARIYPFKTVYRFDKGFVAVDGKFIRISREVDENKLIKILSHILPDHK
jgi:hypothetical protein